MIAHISKMWARRQKWRLVSSVLRSTDYRRWYSDASHTACVCVCVWSRQGLRTGWFPASPSVEMTGVLSRKPRNFYLPWLRHYKPNRVTHTRSHRFTRLTPVAHSSPRSVQNNLFPLSQHYFIDKPASVSGEPCFISQSFFVISHY